MLKVALLLQWKITLKSGKYVDVTFFLGEAIQGTTIEEYTVGWDVFQTVVFAVEFGVLCQLLFAWLEL